MQADLITTTEQTVHLGEQIYEQRLKDLLEPAHNSRVVAIHLPTQKYFLGASLLDASDALRQIYPDASRGEIYVRRIGDLPLMRVSTPRLTNK